MFEEGQEILDKRYRVIKKLGGGAFGEIFKGKSLYSVWKVHIFSQFAGVIKLRRSLNLCTTYLMMKILYVVEKRKTGEHLAAKVVSSIVSLEFLLTFW